MRAYRLLTGADDSAFCHKVTEALSQGWALHGSPAYSYNAEARAMYCAQAVVKDADGEYTPDLKLSSL